MHLWTATLKKSPQASENTQLFYVLSFFISFENRDDTSVCLCLKTIYCVKRPKRKGAAFTKRVSANIKFDILNICCIKSYLFTECFLGSYHRILFNQRSIHGYPITFMSYYCVCFSYEFCDLTRQKCESGTVKLSHAYILYKLHHIYDTYGYHYRLRPCDVRAAMLVELSQKILINFYCMWNQHGRRIIAF